MKRSKLHTHTILFWTVGVLLILSLLTVWFINGVSARYHNAKEGGDSARMAMGLPMVELKEHKANLVNGTYVLDNGTEVTGNTYNRVIPGVDIPKDPFVRLTGSSEISYGLYMQVTKSEAFPSTVSYTLLEGWEAVTGQDGVYRYTGTLTGDLIYILKNNQLKVSENYVDDGEFSLSFSAWVEQID